MPHIEYKTEKLKRILDDLHNLMGITMAIVDVDFHYIYKSGDAPEFCQRIQDDPAGRIKCHCSDMDMLKKCSRGKCFVSHTCHAGIVDAVFPIIKDSMVVGYVIIGRVRKDLDFSNVREKIEWLDCVESDMERAYRELKCLSEVQLESLCDILSHIIFENAIEIEDGGFQHRVSAYIDENIDKKLTVEEICSAMFMSKTLLYKKFHEVFGCTVNECIITRRIQRACELLLSIDDGDKLCTVAEAVGMEYTYFCRLFKSRMGMTPAEYKSKYA
jgi:AraC-like DNA-binding protein